LKKKYLLSYRELKSPIAEAYRSLRTNLQFASSNNLIKTILITSPTSEEGKTTTATNLAITYSQTNKNTLLVDADLRKCTIHKLFDMDKSPGLTTLLIGETDIDSTIRQTQIPYLSVLLSGPVPPNPAELLDSKRMEDLIEKLSKKFDVIIIDSPPIMAVSDPAILAPKVEGVLLVVQAGKTAKDALLRSKILLKNAKANFLGVVLNNVSIHDGYASYYQYYYRYYGLSSEDRKES
jgi:capsular exopolysaccharide synthesis family protein